MKSVKHTDMVPIQTILTRSLMERLDAMAAETALNRSILIRQACEKLLTEQTEIKSSNRLTSIRA